MLNYAEQRTSDKAKKTDRQTEKRGVERQKEWKTRRDKKERKVKIGICAMRSRGRSQKKHRNKKFFNSWDRNLRRYRKNEKILTDYKNYKSLIEFRLMLNEMFQSKMLVLFYNITSFNWEYKYVFFKVPNDSCFSQWCQST